jgi:hypothetical protein
MQSEFAGGMARAATANRTTGADQSFVHDFANGTCAAATLGTATETAIDLAGGAQRGRGHGAPHLMVAQHVAGTDDHRKTKPAANDSQNGTFATGFIALSQRKRCLKKFQTIDAK